MSDFGPDLCHNLAARRSARSLTRLYDAHLAPVGLSVSQYSVLAIIDARVAVTVAELADLMVMERTTLMRALGPLEKAQLIERRQPSGQRALVFALTEEGRSKVGEATPLWEEAQRAFEHRAGSDRAARLRDLVLEIGFEN